MFRVTITQNHVLLIINYFIFVYDKFNPSSLHFHIETNPLFFLKISICSKIIYFKLTEILTMPFIPSAFQHPTTFHILKINQFYWNPIQHILNLQESSIKYRTHTHFNTHNYHSIQIHTTFTTPFKIHETNQHRFPPEKPKNLRILNHHPSHTSQWKFHQPPQHLRTDPLGIFPRKRAPLFLHYRHLVGEASGPVARVTCARLSVHVVISKVYLSRFFMGCVWILGVLCLGGGAGGVCGAVGSERR